MLHTQTRALLAAAAVLGLAGEVAAAPPVDKLSVPPGFTIEVLHADVTNARQLALGDAGTLFAATRGDGRVWAIDGDGTRAIASDLELPSGIAYRDGDLYVGAVSTIYRLDDIEAHLDDPPAPVVVTDQLPTETHHGWKHLEFGPDGKLWVPIGAPCNICDEGDPYASIAKMDPDTGAYEIFARGIRNTVGFDFEPDTGVLWLSDNGRDMLGDDVPPCELNRVPHAGMHFGYPYVHGADILDPEFGEGHDPADYTPPALEMQAHVAPLGIAFYTGDAFPEDYRGALFVAQHGSWNRSSKVGYQVIVAYVEDGEVVRSEPFVTGFLEGEAAWGRPVDVLVHPDGSLLISDDQQGAIYRVRWTGAVADTARTAVDATTTGN
ncbi:MAG TPA: PQQ-dependent sugar dehydrogenase [Pseudomonadales bacterium]|nr:PQQ-dependent sugar dehydrogenase [Pseudomonadales bacterium]